MAHTAGKKWDGLWQGLRKLWHAEPAATAQTPPAVPPDMPPEKSAFPPPAPMASDRGQYRSTPDPRFGSRSAAQRQAYERLLQQREEEAGRDAAEHSRERVERPRAS